MALAVFTSGATTRHSFAIQTLVLSLSHHPSNRRKKKFLKFRPQFVSINSIGEKWKEEDPWECFSAFSMLGRPCVLFVSMRAGRFSTTLPRAICKTACSTLWNVAFPHFVSAVYRARNAPWIYRENTREWKMVVARFSAANRISWQAEIRIRRRYAYLRPRIVQGGDARPFRMIYCAA